jgi:hypothetical protein
MVVLLTLRYQTAHGLVPHGLVPDTPHGLVPDAS